MTVEWIHHVSNFEGVAQPAPQPVPQVGENEQENRAYPISPGTVNGTRRKRVRFNLVAEEKEEEEEEEIRFLMRKLARLRASLQSSENEGKQGLVSMTEGRRSTCQEPSSCKQVLKSCLKRKASSDDEIEKIIQVNIVEDEEGNEDYVEEFTEDDVEEYARALETRNQLVLAAAATVINNRNRQGWDDIIDAQQVWLNEELDYQEKQEQWLFQQNLITCVLIMLLLWLPPRSKSDEHITRLVSALKS